MPTLPWPWHPTPCHTGYGCRMPHLPERSPTIQNCSLCHHHRKHHTPQTYNWHGPCNRDTTWRRRVYWLLLIVEHDTKYPTAYPVRDYTAPTVATILFKHYCTYGAYDALFSDPGSAFIAAVVKELNNRLNIPQKISIVGRRESNGTFYTIRCLPQLRVGA